MLSGELIRLKSLVDDCVRVSRVIQREFPRLEATEQADLAEYIRQAIPRLQEIIQLPAQAPDKPSPK